MSLLTWLFGKGLPQTAIQLARSRGFQQDIVGESNYQDALTKIVGRKSEFASTDVFDAVLVCENDNPHDSNAVGIMISGKKVGHLSSRDAISFRMELAKIDSSLPQTIVDAKIVGGWKNEESEGAFGVKLKLKRPLQKKK